MGNAEGIKNGTQERFFNGACHWGQGWPNASYAKSTTKNYSLQDGEFHLYTCIWDENSIKMYVDLDKQPLQTPYYNIDISKVDPSDEWVAGNYFHKDNFIIFDLAVGGNFTGIWDADKITALNEENGQEASMYINYVKVYQKGTSDEALNTAIPGDKENGESGIGSVLAQSEVGETVVFNLDGVCVARGISVEDLSGSLAPGVYILRTGTTSKKIIVK